MSGEFDLIRRYFSGRLPQRADTQLGIGDDCALLHCSPDMDITLSVDTLVSGVHFFPDVDPARLGHKALAVNLSDLAAMGAQPAWATLALTLPEADEHWLKAFTDGFFSLANRYEMELVGGDTTHGPLTMTVQVMGLTPQGEALRRSGAKPGDAIYVSGPLGSAGLGLKMRLKTASSTDLSAIKALELPEPRIELGMTLRGLASACIDISDGLAQDLSHILTASHVGATIEYDRLPLTTGVRQHITTCDDWPLPLIAGDDYELCFTVPSDKVDQLETRLAKSHLAAICIGHIESEGGLRIHRNDHTHTFKATGYDHFAQH